MRRHARASRFRRYGPIRQFALKVVTMILWPLGACLALRTVGRIRRAYVRAGVPLPEGYRASAAYRAALRYNIPPAQYHNYELWRKERIADLDAYVYTNEHPGLMQALNHVRYRLEDDPIQDKIAFAGFCRQNGVPCPVSLWSSDRGQLTDWPHAGDLWVKPARGNGGRYHQRWNRNAAGLHEYNDKTFSPDQLTSHLQTLSTDRTLIVQPCLQNHMALADLSNGALVVIRFVSGKHKNGTIMPIAATISFPTGKAVTSHAGMLGTLDLKTGQVTDTRACRVWYEMVDTHPDTGRALTSVRVPGWADVCAVIEQAHMALEGYVCVGWDIAVTPDGPVLLEGNSTWNSEQHQESCPLPQPLGRSVLADVACSYWS